MSSYVSSNQDPWQVSAAIPPAGVIPNFIDPRTLRSETIGVTTTLLVLSTFFVGYMVIGHWGKYRLHDCPSNDVAHTESSILKSAIDTVMAAQVIMYGFAGLVLYLIPWARHQWDLPLARLDKTWMKVLLASEFFLSPTILVAKLAILLLYNQMFHAHIPTRYAIYAGIAVNFLIYLPNFGITGALCAPAPGKDWSLAVNIKCARSVIWGPIQGSLSVVEDIYIFCLPIPILLKLNMKRSKKIGTLLIFGTALLVVGLVFRVYLWQGNTIDTTWNVAALYICMLTEVNVAIIVSTLPSVAGLLKIHASEHGTVWKWYHSAVSRLSLSRSSLLQKEKDASRESDDASGAASARADGGVYCGPAAAEGETRATAFRVASDDDAESWAEKGGRTAVAVPAALPADRIVKSVQLRQIEEARD